MAKGKPPVKKGPKNLVSRPAPKAKPKSKKGR
jgi:hypothetical protein